MAHDDISHSVYLDYAAATPLDPAVQRSMKQYWRDSFHNPSALYIASVTAKEAVSNSRRVVAKWLGAQPHQIIFSSGATESNNLAIDGVMLSSPGMKIITSSIEHPSILSPAAKYIHETIPVNSSGEIDLRVLDHMISDDVALVSIIHANNEIGTIQPLRKVAQLIDSHRRDRLQRGLSSPLLLHTDAAQSGNCLDLHVSRLGVDMMTLSSQKLYGPKGIGAFFVRDRRWLTPTHLGGGQEYGVRAGTEPVPLIVGLAKALDVSQSRLKSTVKSWRAKRTRLLSSLSKNKSIKLAKEPKNVLPNIVNFSVSGKSGERTVLELDKLGFQVATGSACSASSDKPSHVLNALGASKDMIDGNVRVSFGRHTTDADINRFCKALRLATER